VKAILFFLFLFFGVYSCTFSQVLDVNNLKPNPEKEKKFSPYIEWMHGGKENFAAWKSANTLQYYKELWYYSESFYVKRNYFNEGVELNEEIIDISRFENQRKENEEVVVTLSGFKDVLVLLPASKLIYQLVK